MSYEVEFAVSVGQWEYVHLKISGKEFEDQFLGKDQDLEVLLGDYHASLKAAVLHGRDQALEAVKQVSVTPEQAIEAVKQTPQALIADELGGKIIQVTDKTTEPDTLKPWERPIKAAPVKPWAEVKESIAAIKADDDDFPF